MTFILFYGCIHLERKACDVSQLFFSPDSLTVFFRMANFLSYLLTLKIGSVLKPLLVLLKHGEIFQ